MMTTGFATPAHLEVARSYLAAADMLFSQQDSLDDADRRDEPAYFLLAHGAELTLKALCSRFGMTEPEVQALGHNLVHAFKNVVQRQPEIAKVMRKIVRANWRQCLRAARTRHVQPIIDYGITSDAGLAELGIPSNADIGDGLPNFDADLRRLSERHSHEGGAFRYLRFGLDQRLVIRAFGLTEFTVPKTIRWGCEHALDLMTRDNLK